MVKPVIYVSPAYINNDHNSFKGMQ